MITFKSVSKVYPGNITALKDVNFFIKPGEFVSVVGQSGSGKTTLIRLLIAEENLTRGQIIIGDWDITNIGRNEVALLRRQIGVIFQDFKLLPKKTAYENVAFALEVSGVPSARIAQVVPQVFKIVGLEKKMDRFPREMSGGEQQRVAIARSLVHRPKILLADEPTGNLDTINANEIIDLLLKINEFGTTVILVTHNREVVNLMKKRVITLDHGHLVSDQASGKYLL